MCKLPPTVGISSSPPVENSEQALVQKWVSNHKSSERKEKFVALLRCYDMCNQLRSLRPLGFPFQNRKLPKQKDSSCIWFPQPFHWMKMTRYQPRREGDAGLSNSNNEHKTPVHPYTRIFGAFFAPFQPLRHFSYYRIHSLCPA